MPCVLLIGKKAETPLSKLDRFHSLLLVINHALFRVQIAIFIYYYAYKNLLI